MRPRFRQGYSRGPSAWLDHRQGPMDSNLQTARPWAPEKIVWQGLMLSPQGTVGTVKRLRLTTRADTDGWRLPPRRMSHRR
jgi:hypothetical protein